MGSVGVDGDRDDAGGKGPDGRLGFERGSEALVMAAASMGSAVCLITQNCRSVITGRAVSMSRLARQLRHDRVQLYRCPAGLGQIEAMTGPGRVDDLQPAGLDPLDRGNVVGVAGEKDRDVESVLRGEREEVAEPTSD